MRKHLKEISLRENVCSLHMHAHMLVHGLQGSVTWREGLMNNIIEGADATTKRKQEMLRKTIENTLGFQHSLYLCPRKTLPLK